MTQSAFLRLHKHRHENILVALAPVPEMPAAKKIPDDLSGYVDFLHPWGSRTLDPGVLLLMFLTFLVGTIIALRVQDVKSVK